LPYGLVSYGRRPTYLLAAHLCALRSVALPRRHRATDPCRRSLRPLTLSATEIRYRIEAARTYKTEDEIRQVLTDFRTWDELPNAGFPAYERPDREPLADHRTKAKIRQPCRISRPGNELVAA
jgi:hypothetical protein